MLIDYGYVIYFNKLINSIHPKPIFDFVISIDTYMLFFLVYVLN